MGLHGESILEAGMHHLAARFRFDSVREDLKAMGVGMMKPFSNFPFLKQAFTEPEKWQVQNERLALLLRKHNLSHEQASTFVFSALALLLRSCLQLEHAFNNSTPISVQQ
jgi:hypothetical protein